MKALAEVISNVNQDEKDIASTTKMHLKRANSVLSNNWQIENPFTKREMVAAERTVNLFAIATAKSIAGKVRASNSEFEKLLDDPEEAAKFLANNSPLPACLPIELVTACLHHCWS